MRHGNVNQLGAVLMRNVVVAPRVCRTDLGVELVCVGSNHCLPGF